VSDKGLTEISGAREVTEKRLLAEFGDVYRDYQQQVPRLIPRPSRCYAPPSE